MVISSFRSRLNSFFSKIFHEMDPFTDRPAPLSRISIGHVNWWPIIPAYQYELSVTNLQVYLTLHQMLPFKRQFV